jgi:amidase
VIGVKDIFDTADQPSQYGSHVFDGNQPVADAAAVALLREGGAVCLGKTITAELVCGQPGPTTNPHRATHTTGGSSMGSVAAVAAGMVDVALGTQTGDSVVRSASFCGVYGFKPTFGAVSTAGVKSLAPSLDTVGWFARDPVLLDIVRVQLTGRPPARALKVPPSIGLVRPEHWGDCSEDSERAVAAVADIAQALDARIVEVELPGPLVGLAERHRTLLAYEAARALTWEHRFRRSKLSVELTELLDEGRTVEPTEVDAVQGRRGDALAACIELFSHHSALLMPAAPGEAPRELAFTAGSLDVWALVGLPAISIPTCTGASGLPVGVQLVAAPGNDARLIALMAWLTGCKPVLATGTGQAQGLLT